MHRVNGSINQLKLAQQNVKTRIEKVTIDLERFIDFDFHIVQLDESFAISDNEGNLSPIETVSDYISCEKVYTLKSHLNNVLEDV